MDEFKVYTIFKHPRDYPDSYILRGTLIKKGKAEPDQVPLLIGLDPDFMREELERRGLMCIGREPDDDPAILETWI